MQGSSCAALGLGVALILTAPAWAGDGHQNNQSGEQDKGLQGFVSVGVGLIPDYEGSQDYAATPYLEAR